MLSRIIRRSSQAMGRKTAMQVDQIMNRDAKVCHPQDSLNKAAQIMWENSCGAVPDDQSRPIGFLTDRDICMAAYTQGKLLKELRVEGAMANKVISCQGEDDLTSAANVMRRNGVRRVPSPTKTAGCLGFSLSTISLMKRPGRFGAGRIRNCKTLSRRFLSRSIAGVCACIRPYETVSAHGCGVLFSEDKAGGCSCWAHHGDDLLRRPN
jgi:predicted transcriptional regulator